VALSSGRRARADGKGASVSAAIRPISRTSDFRGLKYEAIPARKRCTRACASTQRLRNDREWPWHSAKELRKTCEHHCRAATDRTNAPRSSRSSRSGVRGPAVCPQALGPFFKLGRKQEQANSERIWRPANVAYNSREQSCGTGSCSKRRDSISRLRTTRRLEARAVQVQAPNCFS
jgi:hypothetical protein